MKLTLTPKETEYFRRSRQMPMSLKRKVCPCGCGRVVTALELRRYGMSEKCWEQK